MDSQNFNSFSKIYFKVTIFCGIDIADSINHICVCVFNKVLSDDVKIRVDNMEDNVIFSVKQTFFFDNLKFKDEVLNDDVNIYIGNSEYRSVCHTNDTSNEVLPSMTWRNVEYRYIWDDTYNTLSPSTEYHQWITSSI